MTPGRTARKEEGSVNRIAVKYKWGRALQVAVIMGICGMGVARAQMSPGSAGVRACAPDKDNFVCSHAAFHHIWKHAQTAQVETGALDRNGRKQLEEFVASSGKTTVAAGQPADLVLVLVPVESGGVRIGPSGSELSQLSVYLVDTEGKRGALVWSEKFSGQPDMRWPAIVHAAISQFQSEFDKKK